MVSCEYFFLSDAFLHLSECLFVCPYLACQNPCIVFKHCKLNFLVLWNKRSSHSNMSMFVRPADLANFAFMDVAILVYLL